MNGFSILMLIFAVAIVLTGLYMYTGHKLGMIAWRAPYRNLNKEGWINIGKWTMIVSVIPLILAIIGLFLDI